MQDTAAGFLQYPGFEFPGKLPFFHGCAHQTHTSSAALQIGDLVILPKNRDFYDFAAVLVIAGLQCGNNFSFCLPIIISFSFIQGRHQSLKKRLTDYLGNGFPIGFLQTQIAFQSGYFPKHSRIGLTKVHPESLQLLKERIIPKDSIALLQKVSLCLDASVLPVERRQFPVFLRVKISAFVFRT